MSTALASHAHFIAFAAGCAIAFGAQAWWWRRLNPAGAPWAVWVLAATFLGTGWHLMERAREGERREVQSVARDFARLYASEFEVRGHWRLPDEVDPRDPIYLELIALQKRWLTLSPAANDIYTMRKRPDGQHVFVVDSETDYNGDGKFEGEREERTAPGEIYTEVDDAMEQAFRGGPGFNFEPVTDRWGTWVSAYVPLSAPDGRVEAMLGVDFDADIIRQRVVVADWRVIGLTMVAELLLLGASTLVAVARAGAQERQKAQSALRESEEKLRQIFEHASQFFFSHTADGRLTYLSPQAKDFLDCPPEEALRPWTDFLTENPANAIGITLTDAAIQTGETQRPYELELRSMKGRIIWAEVNESPVVVDGKAVAIVGAVTNITERKQVEERQRAETERYQRQRDALVALSSKGGNGDDVIASIRKLTETSARTLGAARVSVWRYNADRSCLQCVDLYELEADRHSAGIELSAEAYPTYFRALEELEVIAAEDACRDARTSEFAENYLRPIGITSMLDAPIHMEKAAEGVLCHEHIGPMRRWTADEETFAVAVASRVSLTLEGWERRQAEEELRWKTALLEAQVDAALDGILVVDDHKTQIIKNDRFNTVWQIPREIAEKMDDRECLRFATAQTKHPQLFSEKVAYLYDHPDEISRDEIELINGTVLDRYSAPIRNKGGKHYGRIWTFRDVTERKQAEAALQDLHGQLLDASRRSGMAEIASNVLHNVGNVLNSVNVSVAVATDRVRDFKVATLDRVAATLKAQPDLAAFLTKDTRGAEVPEFLRRLALCLESDRGAVLDELESLRKHIEHINEIVTVQQRYTRACGVTEVLSLADLCEDALRLNADAIESNGLQVVRDFAKVPPAHVDRHKVLQILVNLIRNAKHALDDAAPDRKRLVLGLSWNGRDRVTLTVGDNGIGIPPENLTRVFAQGFTTRAGGHGFGLHGSANAAREMGGSLSAKSDGPGRGATFILELPLNPDTQKR